MAVAFSKLQGKNENSCVFHFDGHAYDADSKNPTIWRCRY